MKVIRQSREDLKNEDLYFLIKVDSERVQSLSGQTVTLGDWVIAEDLEESTGEIKKVIIFKVGDKTYGSASKTFVKSFEDIVDCFDTFSKIKIFEKMSKNNRKFLMCEYVKP